MTLKRRELLRGTAATVAALVTPGALSGCGDDELSTMFQHGVSSGDPLADRVVLWTRVSPEATVSRVDVTWEVANDSKFRDVVATGIFATDADRDFTVKVDATGLSPATIYHYRFEALGVRSRVGRTKTLPTGPTTRMRLGMMSCSSYAHGYFHGYRFMAERDDLDAVLHLGDYIYEFPTGEYGDLRPYDPPTELLSLDDYRRRYKHYRLDRDLQAVHRQHPFICVWDDHEIANDAWVDGALNHVEGAEGAYSDRKIAARQAYAEYMPIREQTPGAIFRRFDLGDLVTLLMLDTRHHGRSQQIGPMVADDPSRTLLGFDQETWLDTQLASATGRWIVLGQQVMVAPFSINANTHAPFFLDQWDGYPLSRGRLFDSIEANGASGKTVVLTGDIHSSWAADLPRDPYDPSYDPSTGAGSIAVEIVTPGVTSPGFSLLNGEDYFGNLALAACPHMKLGNYVRRGYVVLDVDANRVHADFYHLSSVEEESGVTEWLYASVETEHGAGHLVVTTAPTTV